LRPYTNFRKITNGFRREWEDFTPTSAPSSRPPAAFHRLPRSRPSRPRGNVPRRLNMFASDVSNYANKGRYRVRQFTNKSKAGPADRAGAVLDEALDKINPGRKWWGEGHVEKWPRGQTRLSRCLWVAEMAAMICISRALGVCRPSTQKSQPFPMGVFLGDPRDRSVSFAGLPSEPLPPLYVKICTRRAAISWIGCC
jgi:hypothetical protein